MPLTKNVLVAFKIVLRSAHGLIRDIEHASGKNNPQMASRLQAIAVLIEDELLSIDAGLKRN
jgi:hypothetical protein